MRIINLNQAQISEIEDKFDAFDESHIHYKMEGRILIGKKRGRFFGAT